jgi:hypothetical protein
MLSSGSSRLVSYYSLSFPTHHVYQVGRRKLKKEKKKKNRFSAGTRRSAASQRLLEGGGSSSDREDQGSRPARQRPAN